MKCIPSVNWKSREFFPIILVLQFTFYATVLLDIPIARQVIGFLYFSFIPGLIVVKLSRFDDLDWTETLLFSVGLSIAFLMVGGVLINEFLFLFGVSQPLSSTPLIVIFSSLILIGGVLVYSRRGTADLSSSSSLRIPPFALLFVSLPILSIVGAMQVNAHKDNLVLLLMITTISLLFTIGVLSKKLLPSKSYPFALLMITIALLCHSSLISSYIIPFGSDVPGEYFLFKTAEGNARWSSTLPLSLGTWHSRVNPMLSITILPTVYTNILDVNSTWVFKMLYPLIFSLVPLGLYQIWQTHVGKKYAFFSAFLFIAFETFYLEMLGLNRQMIAELFFVLLLLVIVNKKMKQVNKMTCFMIFSFALVTSHYSLAIFFLFFTSFALVSLIVLKRPSRNITVFMVVFLLVATFAWYIYTSRSATFDTILEFGDNVYRQLGDFLNPASRGETVLTGLGMAESPSIWNTISRIFAYLTQALILAGFVGLVAKRTLSRFKEESCFGDEFLLFSLIAVTFLAALILVPGLANTMNMTRFYHILLFFLAPLCVLGAEFVVKLLSKRDRKLVVSALLLIVLVPYFFFQTEFVFEVAGSDSWSIPLSGYRMSALRLYGHYGYADECSVYGARWLSKNVNLEDLELHADASSLGSALRIYGMVYRISSLSNVTIVADNSVVYLRTLNVVEYMIPFGRLLWNSSELSFIFDDLNIAYTNGGSEIYKRQP